MPDQMPGDVVMPKEYEFDIADSETISGLSGAMKFVGVMSIIFGALELLLGLIALVEVGSLQPLVTMALGVVGMVTGGWLWTGGGAFREVVLTEGSDITLLMIGLRKLRSVFTLQAWLIGICCALVVLGVIMGLMAVASHH
jgi:hypothetical protein